MFNWLQDLYNYISGRISSVFQWIFRALQAVYSYIEQEIANAYNALLDWASTVQAWINSVESAIGQLAITVVGWINGVYAYVGGWIIKLEQDFYNKFASLGRWLGQQIQDVKNELAQFAASLFNWIVSNIFQPLYNMITGGLQQVWNALSFVYELVSDPEKLVAYIAHYLWLTWLDLLKRYDKPIARWFVRSMLGVKDDLIRVLETIITDLI